MSRRRVKFLSAFSLLAALAVWWDYGTVQSFRWGSHKKVDVLGASQRKRDAVEKRCRTVLTRRTYLLGQEHKETVMSRKNFAQALLYCGKMAEAEKEFRALLPFQERLYGAEHEFVFRTCRHLAHCLLEQGKLKEALEFAQRAENGGLKTYGAKAFETQHAKNTREGIEAELKEKQAEERGK